MVQPGVRGLHTRANGGVPVSGRALCGDPALYDRRGVVPLLVDPEEAVVAGVPEAFGEVPDLQRVLAHLEHLAPQLT